MATVTFDQAARVYCDGDRPEGLSSSPRVDRVSLVPHPAALRLFCAATGLRLADA